jgi:hypothetical protein
VQKPKARAYVSRAASRVGFFHNLLNHVFNLRESEFVYVFIHDVADRFFARAARFSREKKSGAFNKRHAPFEQTARTKNTTSPPPLTAPED